MWVGVWIEGGITRPRCMEVRADRAGRSMKSGTTPDFVRPPPCLESVWGCNRPREFDSRPRGLTECRVARSDVTVILASSKQQLVVCRFILPLPATFR